VGGAPNQTARTNQRAKGWQERGRVEGRRGAEDSHTACFATHVAGCIWHGVLQPRSVRSCTGMVLSRHRIWCGNGARAGRATTREREEKVCVCVCWRVGWWWDSPRVTSAAALEADSMAMVSYCAVCGAAGPRPGTVARRDCTPHREKCRCCVHSFCTLQHRVPNFQTYQVYEPRSHILRKALFRPIAPLEGSCHSDTELAKEAAGIGQSTCCNGGCCFTRLQPIQTQKKLGSQKNGPDQDVLAALLSTRCLLS
jgi:hypothetical protein